MKTSLFMFNIRAFTVLRGALPLSLVRKALTALGQLCVKRQSAHLVVGASTALELAGQNLQETAREDSTVHKDLPVQLLLMGKLEAFVQQAVSAHQAQHTQSPAPQAHSATALASDRPSNVVPTWLIQEQRRCSTVVLVMLVSTVTPLGCLPLRDPVSLDSTAAEEPTLPLQ
ncbi:hypothetical protein MHYP_G00196840 [Metynnis hypsauchen]